MNKERYLYRALRQEEIDADYTLIPKSQEPFESHPRLGIDTRLPFVLGATTGHAVRQHQWEQSGFPTRGISTTPHLERALFYAQANKVIVKIDRNLFDKHRVKEYVVKDLLRTFPADIAVPDDDEVILVLEDEDLFPSEIICEIILLD